MTLVDIALAQVIDPFRIGLLVMLVVTSARTARSVGTVIPLALGVVFIAVMIPLTIGHETENKAAAIGVGLVVNGAILLLLLAGRALLSRLTTSR